MCVHECSQSCPTPCSLLDCDLPASSIHELSQARILGVGCHFLLQGIFQIQRSNPCLQCLQDGQVDSLPLNHLERTDYTGDNER